MTEQSEQETQLFRGTAHQRHITLKMTPLDRKHMTSY